MDIIYRAARKQDCPKLGELISLAGEGILEFMVDGLVPGLSPAGVTAYDLQVNKGQRSYGNVMVAEVDQEVKGMAFSYHSQHHRITDEMRKFIPAERLQHLETFYSTRVEDSLYLDTLAVDPDLHGQGVGKKLMELTRQKALDMGLSSLSLIVYTRNRKALELYRRQGFQGVREIPLEIPGWTPDHGAAMLMECKLA